MEIKNIVNFIFEMYRLKAQKHNGWSLVGLESLPSVAEHMLLAAQIGYILSEMEGDCDAEKVASMLIMHDIPEVRTGDQDKIGARYFKKSDFEKQALDDQLLLLENSVKQKWQIYFDEIENRNTKEGVVAKDADWLEVAFQGKKLVDLGYISAQDWINNVAKAVETDSAKQIIEELKKTRFDDWWKDLKKMTYKKLNK